MKILSSILHFIKNDQSKESQIKWSLYLRVWKEFGLPYWKLLAAGALCTVVAAAAEGYAITLVKQMIDEGFIARNMNSLYIIGLQLIAAYSAKSVFTYSKTITLSKAGLLGAAKIRKQLFAHMMGFSQRYFHTMQTGNIMNAFTGLAGAMLELVTSHVMSIIQNVSTLIIMVCLMFWYAPQLTVTLLFLGPCIGVIVTILTRKRRVVARTSFGFDALSLSQISEAISGIKTIQAFGAETQEYRKISKTEDNKVGVGMRAARITGLQSPLLEVLISVGLCGALLIGGHFITSGSLTTGDFTAFLLAMSAAYKPAKTLSNLNGGIQVGLIAAENIFAMLDEQSEIQDRPDCVELTGRKLEVELRDLSFAYDPKDGEVLHQLNLKVEPGQICAFVGQSGGGKSTIFNLISRFYDTTQGQVLINGRDIREYSLKSLRQNIASVSQDVFLFDASISDNIRYGNPEATEEQIIAAAKAANAHDFIMEFPEGYDFKVGERGDLLSGGQKQRIAIARAILKDAPILLLDEATSALDSNSEHLIQQALSQLMKGRTTFVIAHRLSTIVEADLICVVQRGRIIEQGTDAQLYAQDGEYTKLKDLQFKANEEALGKDGSPSKMPI
ncbi:MAG: ABC transporter ATP-binding protein/permease [Succinivibrio sp.]|nr:ABC transporter ATP-binding protein/permease [Succinivibrio sp.]